MQTGVPALVLEPKGPLDMFSPSPNGKTLYYTQSILKKDKSDGTVEVAFIERDVATGNEKELIRKDHSLYAKCSPDGQYCAVTSSDAASNSRVLLLFSSSGGKPSRELLRLPAEVKPEDLSKANVGPWIFTLSWTADSRSLLLRKVEPNKDDELWIVSVDGQPSGKLQHTRVPEILPSPDNRYAAYRVLGSATTEISVLENFLPKSTPARK
jgi:dipeptidyl aminopeptidase/acylaminoacyl peptidase